MSTRPRWQAAHLAWVLPLVIAGCAWGVVLWVAEYETSHSGIRTTIGSVIAIAGAVALVLAAVSVLLGIRNAWRNSRTIRHRGREKRGRKDARTIASPASALLKPSPRRYSPAGPSRRSPSGASSFVLAKPRTST